MREENIIVLDKKGSFLRETDGVVFSTRTLRLRWRKRRVLHLSADSGQKSEGNLRKDKEGAEARVGGVSYQNR